MKIMNRPFIHDEGILTWANAVTVLRVFVSLSLFALAASSRNEILNYWGLGIFWALDILDGALARRLDQETIFGAQLDILADRILIVFFYLNYQTFHPQFTPAIVLFLVQFMVLDHYLSNQFLRWPIISPNYFDKVDRVIWQLNWSPVGKVCNSGLVTILLLATSSLWITLPVVLSLIGLKIYSCVRWHYILPTLLHHGAQMGAD